MKEPIDRRPAQLPRPGNEKVVCQDMYIRIMRGNADTDKPVDPQRGAIIRTGFVKVGQLRIKGRAHLVGETYFFEVFEYDNNAHLMVVDPDYESYKLDTRIAAQYGPPPEWDDD